MLLNQPVKLILIVSIYLGLFDSIASVTSLPGGEVPLLLLSNLISELLLILDLSSKEGPLVLFRIKVNPLRILFIFLFSVLVLTKLCP